MVNIPKLKNSALQKAISKISYTKDLGLSAIKNLIGSCTQQGLPVIESNKKELVDIDPIKTILKSDLFDAEWYLDTNPDVKNAGIDATYHFYTRGWLEGRSPSLSFDMGKYLKEFNPSECPLLYCREKYKPKESFFSVIVASYNYEKEIETCLSSLASQNYDKFEVIVVDDGSTDSSLQVISKFQSKYPFIRLFTHPNGENKGLPQTIDLAISKCRGKYISFCESDDYWTKDHLYELNKEIQKSIACNQEPKIIVNDVSLIGDKGRISEIEDVVEYRKNKLLEKKGSISPEEFKFTNFIVTFSACCVKRDAFKTCNILDVPKQTALDWWLWRQLAYGSKINYIDKKLTFWRLHQSYNIRDVGSEDSKESAFQTKLEAILEIQNKKLSYTRKTSDSFLWSKRLQIQQDSKEIIGRVSCNDLKPVRILYVTTTSQTVTPIRDGSSRYRAYHMAETLRKAGAFVSVTTNIEFRKTPSLDYEVYVFHRPAYSLREQIIQLKQLGKIIIADYDDLIFGDEKIAQTSSAVINRKFTLSACTKYYAQNLEVLSLFDNVTASTIPLADQIKHFFPRANVNCIHNFIPDSILELSRQQNLLNEKKDKNLITYCSGTASHVADFKLIEEVLLNALEKNSNLKLLIIGILNTSRRIQYHPRIFFHPPVDYPNLFKLMSGATYSIAPLESSIFNSCKSNVKFLESSIAGTTLIATPIPDMRRVSEANIYLPDSVAQWQEIFSTLPEDSITETNRFENYEYLKKNCSSVAFQSQFINLFRNFLYE